MIRNLSQEQSHPLEGVVEEMRGAHPRMLSNGKAPPLARTTMKAQDKADGAERNHAPSTRNSGTGACSPTFDRKKRRLQKLKNRKGYRNTTLPSKSLPVRRSALMRRNAVVSRSRWLKRIPDTTSLAAIP
jgi:hypothetical protein